MRLPSGFTLIEVMGALLILSVAMMSAVRLATASMDRLTFVDRRAEAVRLAGERADSLGSIPYASVQTGVRTNTLQRGLDTWQVTESVTQWSDRVRRADITVRLVADTTSSSSLTLYRVDTW